MDKERLRAKQEVDDLLASGAIASFGDWQKVVRHPPTTGVATLEGQEFEGELGEGEQVYLTPADEALVAADEADLFRTRQEALADDAPEGAEASRLALSAVTRLERLKDLRAQHAGCQLPAAAGLVDEEIKQLSRGLRAGGRTESQIANEKLSAFVEGVVEKEKRLLRKRRAGAAKQKRIARKQAAQRKKVLHQKKGQGKGQGRVEEEARRASFGI